MSILDGTSLVQADSGATYFLAQQSSRSQNTYQYVKANHTTQESEIVYGNIYLPGYTMFGMCIHNDELDYLIGIEDVSGDIQIIRYLLQNDPNNPGQQIAIVQDYKVVDKDQNVMLTGNLYIDCKFDGEFKGVNTYAIGILGYFFEPNAISNYYFAKFSTKYNLTEYSYTSDDLTVMEVPRKIYMDIDNRRVYLAIEINKNSYYGRTVFQPGEQPGGDNSNVAIVCYSWTHGVREWITVIGSPIYSDVFVDLQQYENNVYVVMNSVTSVYSSNSSQTDINYYRLRSENGIIVQQQIFGSPLMDTVLNMQVSFNGVYLYAMINQPFLPHRQNNMQWQTIGNNTNLALIHIDFTDQIVDIESWDYTNPLSNNYINPYPMRFFLIRQTNVTQNYIFVTHRSNQPVDRKGGIYITYFVNAAKLWMSTAICPGIGCQQCSGAVPSKCLTCMTIYQLFQHNCYEGQCPQYTFQITDRKNNWASQKYCQQCHYSCKTCSGSREDQCSSCCIDGDCGPTYNRVPLLGKCLCPNQLTEVNGICNSYCVMDLGARRDQKCMTACPTDSYPMLKYDGLLAQETSQSDNSGGSNCDKYSNQLQFTKQSMGLPLPGPGSLTAMPEEFNIAFWVMPTDLNPKSYLINLFNRAYIWAELATTRAFYKYITGDLDTSFIQPTNPVNTDQQKIALSTWNYISVSQRQVKTLTDFYYQIQVGIVQGNFGAISDAGSTSGTIEVVKYSLFKNTIYLGAQSDIAGSTSFAGYIKELQVYLSYRGLAQMESAFSRTQRLYSYDDPTLIAYWKLDELYTSLDQEYTINDYSYNQNMIQYSHGSDPQYPFYTLDSSKTLNLCYLRDVVNCYSLDYSGLPPVATSSRSYIRLPTLDLQEFNRISTGNLIRGDNDMLFYVPQNTDCGLRQNILASMNFSTAKGIWQVTNDTFNPMYLLEATHYQLCYYIQNEDVQFNLAQVYVAYRPRTVDPSDGNIYNRSNNYLQFMTGFGDQAYGDVLRLARNCDDPEGDETEFVRSNVPGYDKVAVINAFNLSGTFYFCWMPMFINDYLSYPIYESVHNLYYMIQYEPILMSTFRTEATTNQDMIILQTQGTFIDGDYISLAWSGLSYSDCNPMNFLGEAYMFNHSSWPGLWMGYDTGVHGLLSTNMDELQVCWKPGAQGAPSVYIRVKKEDGTPYTLRGFGYLNVQNQRCPELVSFDPPYGSSVILETDRIINFNFKPQSVIPCKMDNAHLGMIQIFRGAVKSDGTYVKIITDILWQNIALNENTLPDPFQQGDLICTQTGQCSIILSQDTNRMKAGEVYFLTFYPYSFLTIFNNVNYYLFNTGYTYGTPAYDHFFMCRSFDIYPSNQLINGRIVKVTGVDLRSKLIKAKYAAGIIDSDIFYTKAINLKLQVFNTDQYQCTYDNPTATVAMEDVFDTYFIIRNLELRECDQGQLFADIEFLRGIRDDNADYSYLKAEKIYNIQIGSIGCDPSCKVCNGTLDTNCMICENPTYKLFMGKCYPVCPTGAPEMDTYSITYQNLLMTQQICVASCPFGEYADAATGNCVLCNADCQTCNSSTIASCQSCNPIKYLYNGMCVSACPQPHHVNNLTDYICHVVSQPTYLQVSILSLGFISRIPKDRIVYLKADINNTGGGNISSILWQQMEPTDPNLQVLSQDADGTHNTSYQMVRLNNNKLMQVPARQTVKVNCTVTNTFGDIAYDIYEFFVNDSPFTGTMAIQLASDYRVTTNFNAVDDLLQLNLTNWYDSSDDTVQMLKMKIHVIQSMSVGNTVQSQQMTVTDLVGQNTLYFRVPPIFQDMRKLALNPSIALQPNFGLVNITYCVSAIDMFNAISAVCQNLENINNKMSFFQDYSQMVTYLNSTSYTQNITNLLFASNVIFQVVQPPARPNTQPHICTSDLHCNLNGICQFQTGTAKCECNVGYFGTYCDFKEQELPQLQQIASNILDEVLLYTSTKVIAQFDAEIIANVVRGLTNHPDIVDDLNFYKVLSLLETASQASIYVHQPYDLNITGIFFDAYTNVQLKMAHSLKLRQTTKNYMLLGLGMNLFFFQNAFTLQDNPNLIHINNSDAFYFVSDLNKTSSLIAGVQSPRVPKAKLLINETLLYQNWGRRFMNSFEQFCLRVMYKLDPNTNTYIYKGKAFEFELLHLPPVDVIGQNYIKTKDAYWNFPPDLFDSQPGVASSFHEIKFKLMKHILHPFQFEQSPGAFLESNVTSIEYNSLAGSKIVVSLSNTSTNFIEFREPYNNTRGYGDEWASCMSWNSTAYQFISDQSCGFQFSWEVIPCSDCDQYNYINTTISLCRCKSITNQLAVVYYGVNATNYGAGFKNSIYTDFFALGYWQQSFGYMAVLAGFMLLVAGHILIWLLDGRLRRNLIIRLREKARNFELQHGAEMQRHEGLFIKVNQQKAVGKSTAGGKKSMVASTKKTFKEGGEEPAADGAIDEGDQPQKKKLELQKRRKILPMKKKLFEDEEEPEEGEQSDSIDSEEEEKMLRHIKIGKNQAGNDEAIQREMAEMHRAHEEKKRMEAELDKLADDSSEDEEIDLAGLTPQQIEQYQRHRGIIQKLRAQKQPQYLYHELMMLREDQVHGMTQNEFRRKIVGFVAKLPKQYQKDPKLHLAELKQELHSTDEELVKSMKDVFYEMQLEREKSLFRYKNMIINGSLPLSLMYVTSILSPRHVRWTLLIMNMILLWFICGVYFNNTKDPMVVPNYSKGAGALAMNDMWIGIYAPIGSMILMWVISSFLKIPNSQFINVVTLRQMEVAIIEHKMEQRMRFFMGYLVVCSIMGYIFYYIVSFTATYGWKVSWVWFYCGIVALFIQFAIYDPIIASIHWLVQKYFKEAGRRCQKFRSLTQGYNESYDPSDGEIEERKQKEEEERLKKKRERIEKKNTRKSNKKQDKVQQLREMNMNDGDDLFGEAPPVQEGGPDAAAEGEEEVKSDAESRRGKSSGHESAEDALKGGSSGNDQQQFIAVAEDDTISRAASGTTSSRKKKKKKKKRPVVVEDE